MILRTSFTSKNVKLVRSIIARHGDLLQKGVAIVDGGYENPVKYEYVACLLYTSLAAAKSSTLG